MNEVDIPNHPDAVCFLHGIPCRELGEVLKQRDALRVEAEELRHRANGWADIANSGPQWLRNVRDGLSTPQTAIENMEALIADLREGRWRAIPDPAIRAEDLVEALSDEPAAPQGEVQP